MKEVQILRRYVPEPQVARLREMSKTMIAYTESGEHPYGRIYDDLWPINLAGVDFGNHIIILCTTRYPYDGQWHCDAPPGEEDTIILLCVDGLDELEYLNGVVQYANLRPGDVCLLPARTWHRGHCSTHRITWHMRVGPDWKPISEQPAFLPPMTLRRFLGRTWRTLSYYVRQIL